ncbi:DNA polymerase [Bradyrhizobium neotropicale]|uniref:DNA polymerase n=1 Tax=Bradyrhizobium neotropicale TaxID=1497615 RepID=UPI001AD624B0|nr:DNA polymerase [Bradyrhizobium neotropicale]MBO4228059.1 XRE family transcriptional regulator [Bradyrhizobium neotropicale]
MTVVHLDFETRSACDLKVHGVYVYASHPTTDVHCMAYAFDDEPVQLWRRGEPIPPRLENHIVLGGVITAHNAQFERAIFRHVMAPRYGWPNPDVEQWRCTMIYAYAMALPGALEHMGPALNTGFDKDMAGNRLMLAMSKPRRPKKGEPTDGILWREAPEDLERLYSYCRSDVEAERAGDKRLVRLRPFEQALWHLDQRINDRGVPVDAGLAKRNLAIVDAHTRRLDREMAEVTDFEVSACSNVNQLKTFLKSKGVTLGEKLNKATMQFTETLDKESVTRILLDPNLHPAARRALELRQEGGKASVDKIDALINGMDADGRARGLLQFHAANTGRWGGRRFQPQNILRPDEDFDVDGAIDVILKNPTARAMDILDACFGTPITCVSYTLRGMVAAPKGKKIVAADYSNVEGVVLAWLANEKPRLQAFREYFAGKGPDLYCVAASGIYGIPNISKKTHPTERQVGKVAELACGYGGGVGAFQTMAATQGVHVPDDQAEEIKNAWRESNPAIVKFWSDLEDAAIAAINQPGRQFSAGPITYKVVGSFLWCRLPSGRALAYPYPKVLPVKTPWGQMKDAVTFKTVPNVSNRKKIVWEDSSNTNKWARISTYGGALCENVTQAVARDLLAEGLVRLEGAGYPIILTVHDEAVSEVDEGFGSASEYEEIMCELPSWASGLPLAASGFEAERYRK